MHARCFCHKLALIVNAALAALLLKTLPPGKSKQSVLGYFPVLGKVAEEDEANEDQAVVVTKTSLPVNVQNDPASVSDSGTDSDYGNADESLSEYEGSVDSDDETEPTKTKSTLKTSASTKYKNSTKLLELTQKLDVVIKTITRSAAQRSNFDRTAEKLKLKVAPLIAGYGSRWNIRYQSYQKAINAREVIDHILKEDQEQNQAGLFADVLFSPRDWKEIDNLNAQLEVFVKLTAEMEGDSATGCHVLPKYLELRESLKEKLELSSDTDSLYPMLHAMLQRVDKYLKEAMQCHTLVLATLMHPCFRMHLFELVFGANSPEVTTILELLKDEFQRTKAKQQELAKNKNPIDPDVFIVDKPLDLPPTGSSLMNSLASRMAVQPTAEANEVESYLQADLSFNEGDIERKTTPLKWWQVC
ncbi:hypothetical protein PGTUg99_005802 [Puccinia graminis f. sp. tritici]|uniref:hAT-like transposase RNase-H fold domain-containing protein n=1 Tax=Puccinia graminis f. sp. tritici TaxID=56615 RepID=A0A5B0S9V9_PUCGR|nr:hypothetical protein PGTUg99_005802 [Puccinia graminis f. sp. tritici]